jgi:hypothetical protein
MQQGLAVGRDAAQHQGAAVKEPRKWRALGARIVLIAFAIDVLAYALKLILPWRLFATHETFVIVGDEIGLLFCVFTFLGAVICLSGWKAIATVVGSLVVGYFWFASVAWWVMVK